MVSQSSKLIIIFAPLSAPLAIMTNFDLLLPVNMDKEFREEENIILKVI